MSIRKKLLRLLGVLGTLSGILAFFDYTTKLGNWLSTVFGGSIILDYRWILYIIGICLFPLYLIVSYIQREHARVIDSRFVHLTIHYSQITDTPDTPNPARPYFVVNEDTSQAYQMPNLIRQYVKKKKIQWRVYDGEKALRAYFKKRKITINDSSPKLEELGLIINRNGSLSVLPQIVSKLKNRKLDDLEIEWLFPWYYHLLPSQMRDDPPNKRLLRKFSTKETFHAPDYDLELTKNRIIAKQSFIRRPFESLEKWSKRRGYTYQPRSYREDELLEES